MAKDLYAESVFDPTLTRVVSAKPKPMMSSKRCCLIVWLLLFWLAFSYISFCLIILKFFLVSLLLCHQIKGLLHCCLLHGVYVAAVVFVSNDCLLILQNNGPCSDMLMDTYNILWSFKPPVASYLLSPFPFSKRHLSVSI